MNQQYGYPEKEEAFCSCVSEAALQSAKVMSVVRNEAMEEFERWLNMWICQMMIVKKA